MDIKQINSAIMFGTWSNEELNSIVDAVKFARSCLSKTVKYTIRTGSQVKFTSSKTGRTMSGTVEKVAIKFATVATPQGRWKVPMNMLTVE